MPDQGAYIRFRLLQKDFTVNTKDKCGFATYPLLDPLPDGGGVVGRDLHHRLERKEELLVEHVPGRRLDVGHGVQPQVRDRQSATKERACLQSTCLQRTVTGKAFDENISCSLPGDSSPNY